jgi:hypothetical protein
MVESGRGAPAFGDGLRAQLHVGRWEVPVGEIDGVPSGRLSRAHRIRRALDREIAVGKLLRPSGPLFRASARFGWGGPDAGIAQAHCA